MEKIRNIVVATDFSALAEGACARAASLARLYDAEVHVVHALAFPILAAPYEVSVPPHLRDDLRAAAQGPLERTRKAIEARGVRKVTAGLADSADAVTAICDAARSHDADLIVIGTHGRAGVAHAFLGSVAERVLRAFDRPILAVKEDAERAAKPIEKILLAIDFSRHSDRAVEVVEALAARLPAFVEVLHVLDLPIDFNPYLSDGGVDLERKIETSASERLERIHERFEKRGIRVNTHFRRGHPDVVICDVAKEISCQLIAMGTRGRSGLAHVLLGSVAERTLRTAPCSVLCAKASDAAVRL